MRKTVYLAKKCTKCGFKTDLLLEVSNEGYLCDGCYKQYKDHLRDKINENKKL